MRRAGEDPAGESTPLVASSASLPAARDAHLDNCKFFLMCVVVFNHCFQDYFEHVLDPTTGREWCGSDASWFFRFARGAYLYLNLLGMPAFAVVSGFCSRGFVRAAREGLDEDSSATLKPADPTSLASRSRQMVETLLVPYVIWQTFYALYNYATWYPAQAWSPIGVTWYLTSLFAWRASAQYVAALRGALPLTFALGLAVGFTDTPATANGLPFLDFQRALVFAPLFYLGALEGTPERVAALRSRRALGWAVTLVSFGACVAAFARGGGDRGEGGTVCFDEAQRWAWNMEGYAGASAAEAARGAGRRAGFYAAAIATALGFFAVAPGTRGWYTEYGSRTMYAYLLHLLLVRGFVLANEEWLRGIPRWASAGASFLALPTLGSVGLMAPWCKRCFWWCVEPRLGAWMWVRG